ncbi:MAG: multidrug effflux MFS transporter [Alphaproteobacteria bacterium]|nr:multidrug effflux MFS transporter [Alphaproteobacteria bacterium]
MDGSTQPQKAQTGPRWNLLLLLMAMTAIGPTTLNILVPAIPALTRRLGADGATVQFTVSVFLLALAGGQLAMGPLSDRFGRRPVLLAGLALTALASLLPFAAPNVTGLVVARILQAVGAAAGIVIGRAIIRDLFERDRAAAMIGLVATVMVVVPSAGPLIGGVLDTAFGWEAIFLFTAVTSLAVLAWAAVTLPETRGLNAAPGLQAGFMRDLRALSISRNFNGYILIATFGSGTFFAFLGGSPHVAVTSMGLTSAEYGLWFAASSLGYMLGNYVASQLSPRFGIDRLILWGIGFETVGVIAAVALAWAAPGGGPMIVFAPQSLISFGNGLLLPGAIAGAVSVRPQAAGTAAGITGFAQMTLGAAMVQYGGWLLAGAPSALPLALLMAALVLALIASYALLERRT